MAKSEFLVNALGSIDVHDAAVQVARIRDALQLAPGVLLGTVISTAGRRCMDPPTGPAVDVYSVINRTTRQIMIALAPSRHSRDSYTELDEAIRADVNGGDDPYRSVLLAVREGQLGPDSAALVAGLRRFVGYDVLNAHLLVGLVVRNFYFNRYPWYFALVVIWLIEEARANVLWHFDVQTSAFESLCKLNPRGAMHGLSTQSSEEDAIAFFFRRAPDDYTTPNPFGRIPLHRQNCMLRLGTMWSNYVRGWPWYQFFLNAALRVVARDGWVDAMRSKTPAGEQLIAVLWLSDARFRTQHRLGHAIAQAIQYNNIEGAIWGIACYKNSDELVEVARGNRALVCRLLSGFSNCLTVYPLLCKLHPCRLLGTIDVLVTFTNNTSSGYQLIPFTHILALGWSLLLNNVLATHIGYYLRVVLRIMWRLGVHTGSAVPKMYTMFVTEIHRLFPSFTQTLGPALAIYQFPADRSVSAAEFRGLMQLTHTVCSFDPNYWTRPAQTHREAENRRRLRLQYRAFVIPQYVWQVWRGAIEKACPAIPPAHCDPTAFLAVTTRKFFPFVIEGKSHGVRARLTAIGSEFTRFWTAKLAEQRLGRCKIGLPVLPYEVWSMIYMWVVRLTVASSSRLACYKLSV